MWQFWLAYLLFLSICSEGQTATLRKDAPTLLEKANTEYRSSHFSAAIDLYREYLARYRDRPDVRVYLGAALLSASKTDAAFEEAKRAIQLDDHYAKAYTLEGRIYSAGQHWDLAEQCFAKALSLDPNDRETWYFSGLASYQGAQFTIAVKEFQRAITLGANQSRVYENLGLAYEALGEVKNAESSYQHALQLSPVEYRPYLAYGVFLFKHGRSAESKSVLERAFSLAADSVEVRFQLGRLLYHSGDLERAAQILQGALASNECRVHNLLARVFFDQGKKAEGDKELAALTHCQAEPSPPQTRQTIVSPAESAGEPLGSHY
jgi:tetratricopeptide (TPR) repeat protein